MEQAGIIFITLYVGFFLPVYELLKAMDHEDPGCGAVLWPFLLVGYGFMLAFCLVCLPFVWLGDCYEEATK